jgi:alkyl hydroperoxide reductase subunit AhpC
MLVQGYLGSLLVKLFVDASFGPGVCTYLILWSMLLQACYFRDSYEAYKIAGAEVIGISSDSVESHKVSSAPYPLSVNQKCRFLNVVPVA